LIIVAIILGVLGGLVIVANWVIAISASRSKRHMSMVPVVGAALAAVALLLVEGLRRWAWLPIVLDLGTLGMLAACVHSIARAARPRA
jgi:hypothetical protein